MANRLSMAKVNAILSLHQSGHSNRRIAKLLGVDRETVSKYVGLAAKNPPNAPTVPNTSTGPPSSCEAYREVIQSKLEQRLSAKRIYQDLVAEHQFTGSYWSVRRYVARLKQKLELPFRRLETEPGEEAQVDFGSGALVITAGGSAPKPPGFERHGRTKE
jgi:transposase